MIATRKKIALCVCPPCGPMLPPLNLGVLQAFLESRGITADIIDLNNYFYTRAPRTYQDVWRVSNNRFFETHAYDILTREFPKAWRDAVDRLLIYDVVGFSCFKSNAALTQALGRLLKKKKKSVLIVVGGPETARRYFLQKNSLDTRAFDFADSVVVGEGEKPLYDFLSGTARHRRVTVFDELDETEDVPVPRYRGVALKDYPRRNTMPLLFSRGCVKRCRFCAERLLYKTFKRRSARSLVREVAYHRQHAGAQSFVFYDSILNGHLGSLEELCRAVHAGVGAVPWEAQIAVRNDMPERILQEMKQSGCYNLFIGLESGCGRTLRSMRKGYTPLEARAFFEKLRRAGLHFGVSMIVGYPGETEEDFRQSLKFIVDHKELIPKVEQVNPFVYYEGIDVRRADMIAPRVAMRRYRFFIDAIKQHRIKHTNAFLGNLLDKDVRV